MRGAFLQGRAGCSPDPGHGDSHRLQRSTPTSAFHVAVVGPHWLKIPAPHRRERAQRQLDPAHATGPPGGATGRRAGGCGPGRHEATAQGQTGLGVTAASSGGGSRPAQPHHSAWERSALLQPPRGVPLRAAACLWAPPHRTDSVSVPTPVGKGKARLPRPREAQPEGLPGGSCRPAPAPLLPGSHRPQGPISQEQPGAWLGTRASSLDRRAHTRRPGQERHG